MPSLLSAGLGWAGNLVEGVWGSLPDPHLWLMWNQEVGSYVSGYPGKEVHLLSGGQVLLPGS